jgi:hypothetical protein
MISTIMILMGTLIFKSNNIELRKFLQASQLSVTQSSLIQTSLIQPSLHSHIELPIEPPLSIAQAQTCRPLSAFQNSPIQTLPAPFENGCALYFYYGGNNSAASIYVFRTDANLAEIRPVGRSEQELGALVEQGQALRILWFYTATLGNQRLYGSIPRDRAFLDRGNICMWMGRTVVCLEATTLRPREIEEILRTNKQQWESRDS